MRLCGCIHDVIPAAVVERRNPPQECACGEGSYGGSVSLIVLPAPMNDSENPPNSDSLGSSASCVVGPFSPPGDYNFEPELHGQPPRAIPATFYSTRRGRLKRLRKDRNDAWYYFWFGIACLLIGVVWAVLGEFGGAAFGILAGIGLGIEAGLRLISGPRAPASQSFKYIRDGFPLVVRVGAAGTRPYQA